MQRRLCIAVFFCYFKPKNFLYDWATHEQVMNKSLGSNQKKLSQKVEKVQKGRFSAKNQKVQNSKFGLFVTFFWWLPLTKFELGLSFNYSMTHPNNYHQSIKRWRFPYYSCLCSRSKPDVIHYVDSPVIRPKIEDEEIIGEINSIEGEQITKISPYGKER